MKYEMTGEIDSMGLTRIRALVDIPRYGVTKGLLGGFIESERNLSQEGCCWIDKEAKVFGFATVAEDAYIGGRDAVFEFAEIRSKAQVYGVVHGCSYVKDCAVISSPDRLYGYVCVRGDAVLNFDSDYVTFEAGWSVKQYITWTRSNDMWQSRTFYGTAEELLSMHAGSRTYKDYRRLVEYVNEVAKKWP